MSIRHIKAVDRFYVVSTGYTPDDFIDSGEASPEGTVRSNTDWPVDAAYSWFKTKEQQLKHPAMAGRMEVERVFSGRLYIDGESGLSIAKMHAAKASEAREVKFNAVTDPTKLPFIAAEVARQPAKTIADIADEIWAEHIVDADPESARTEAKRNL